MRQCLICMEDLDEEIGYLLQISCGCMVKYHKECLLKWISYKNCCPICKKVITIENYSCKNIMGEFRFPFCFYVSIAYCLITFYMSLVNLYNIY